MKIVLFCFILIAPVFVQAQSSFTVTGKGGLNDGDKIYLVYKVNNKPLIDSVSVINHQFKFAGTTTGIHSGYVCRNDNPDTASILRDAKNFYIEPGNIMITTNDSLYNAELSGTTTNNDLSVLTHQLESYSRERNQIEADYDALTAQQVKDIEMIAPIRARLKLVLLKMSPVQLSFIKSHPQSYVSLVTLQEIVNNEDMLAKNSAAFNSLSPSLKATSLGLKLKEIIATLSKTAIGSTAKNFTLTDNKGNRVRLSNFRGKYTLVDFWASWCLPCREEMPNVVLAYNKFKSKDFTVVGISLDDAKDKKAWINAISADGALWTQLLDANKKVKALYGITTIPANILINPDGKIIARNLKDKTLLIKLDELLGGK